ncbi:hypothetical protein HHK36_002381 [Tetracentron sinense]|uniref:CP12 domain-containing protein n=1 Tax=Tetracentron sinense TaxID=13715 RepID=A0A835DMT1_TETSI|nr:hypothetical protein HHK36_002381 [Tetracentron sinense]
MAALQLHVASSGSRDPNHLIRRSSKGFGERYRVCLPFGPRQEKVLMSSVKAMAVAKFKGTQMREKQLTEMIEKKVVEAKEVCEGNQSSDECKVAWDEVEEVSQAKADLRRKMEKEDPLESFCLENPETDECRIYGD